MINNLLANAEDTGSILGSGRSPGDGNDNPLQYPCLECVCVYVCVCVCVCVCVYEYNTYKIKSGSQMKEVGRMRRMTLLWFPASTPNHVKSLSILTVSLGFG